MTKTKNERITTLENEVAELKLIVHELRGKKSIEPSTAAVEDIIEFEGANYRKVDREARKGDVIVARVDTSNHVVKDVPYKVTAGEGKSAELGELAHVYYRGKERTPETVDVYELIKGGLNPQIPILDETIEPLTPNQQRAAMIEKAKKFVKENIANGRTSGRYKDKGNSTYRNNFYDVDFFVKERKVTVVVYWLEFNEKRVSEPSNVGRAKCNPNDVFNEHIGKAVALGRALGLDVSEFEQAVQPDELVVGMIVERFDVTEDEILEVKIVEGTIIQRKPTRRFIKDDGDRIINDTNAKYDGWVKECQK